MYKINIKQIVYSNMFDKYLILGVPNIVGKS